MLNEKDDNDWFKRYITWEVEGIRQRGCSKKTWWDCVKNDMESLGLSQKDAQSSATTTTTTTTTIHRLTCTVHSVELRELEAMLKAAYTSKAHVAQMAEREAMQRQERQMDLAAAQVMLEQCRREEAAQQEKEVEQYRRLKRHHMEVKKQMEVGYSPIERVVV